jgi:hypothetical protein
MENGKWAKEKRTVKPIKTSETNIILIRNQFVVVRVDGSVCGVWE